MGAIESANSSDRSLDVVCDLLASQRRQYVLASLLANPDQTSLTDLVEAVAMRENTEPISEISAETVETITVSLYHTHLPKLVDVDVIEYDQDRDVIRIAEPVDLVEHVLSLTDAVEEV